VRELLGITPSKLQCDRTLRRVKSQKPLPITTQYRAGSQHLGINERTARQQTVEKPAVPVSPFHHRSDTKAPIQRFPGFLLFFNHLVSFVQRARSGHRSAIQQIARHSSCNALAR